MYGDVMLKRKQTSIEQFRANQVVKLVADIDEPRHAPFGGTVRAGLLGTVVDVLDDETYLVEFERNEDGSSKIMTLHAHLLGPCSERV